ncbi:MAG: hypothetical protein ACX98W_19085 [bacterium]
MRLHLFVISLLAIGLGAAPFEQASAQSNDFDVDGWTPAASVWGGFLFTEMQSNLVSSDVLGPAAFSPPELEQPIQPPGDGEDLQPAPFIGGSLELMTPALIEDLPGRPRLFVHGGATANFAQEDDLTRRLDARPELSIPASLLTGPNDTAPNLPAENILGQGSRATVRIEPLAFSAGIGIALEVPVFDRIVRIKPSVEYFSYEVEASGIVNRAVAVTSGGSEPNELSDFRRILLEYKRTKRFHGIGPGLEIESDVARLGPFVTSVYATGRLYSILGGRQIDQIAFNDSASDPQAQQENVRSSTEVDRWAYRAGVGLRLHWAPER